MGYQYAWGGMNERGLSLTTMSLDETRQPTADARPPLDSGEWVQYILDTCATVEEVIATDSQVRIFTVDHYLIGDRFGNAAVIEFLDGRMVSHTAPNLPVAALTNNVYEDSCTGDELVSCAGSGTLERKCVGWTDFAGFDNSRELLVEVRAFWETATCCGFWDLTIEGNACWTATAGCTPD